MWLLLGATAHAAPPTLAEWTDQLGAPSKSPELTDRVRTPDEPLLMYWMQTQAAPLGTGPALPGTLVANFRPAAPLGASVLQDFTFLAMADPAARTALRGALSDAGCTTEARTVQRSGGRFDEVVFDCTTGVSGTLAVRAVRRATAMADGRPSPDLWVHATWRSTVLEKTR